MGILSTPEFNAWLAGLNHYERAEVRNRIVVHMLLGGSKHGQERDIAQARKILERDTS